MEDRYWGINFSGLFELPTVKLVHNFNEYDYANSTRKANQPNSFSNR